METVNVQCGHCGQLLAVSKEHLGQQVRCPHCQQVVVAPLPPPPAEAPAAQEPVYVYFRHDDEPAAPAHAARLRELLECEPQA